MKRNIINKLILSSLFLGFMSCTGNYMDINSNPYEPDDLSPDDYALGSAMSGMASTVIASDVTIRICTVYGLLVGRSFGWLLCRF